MMEAAVIQMLLDDAGVAAQVGARVYPTRRPQGGIIPALVVRRISGSPEYASDGEIGLQNGRIQIDAYATTYAAVMAVSAAVKVALSAVADVTVAGVDVRFITIVYERDADETGAAQAEYLFRRQTDIEIWIGD